MLVMSIGLSLPWDTALAQSAVELVQPVVERDHYEQLCRRLHLQREDRVISDAAFEQYADDVKSLLAGAEHRAEEAGLERIRGVVSGRGSATPEQLAQWELAVHEAFAQSWPEVDRLFDTLQRDLDMHLAAAPASERAAALRALRRESLLHPRQARARDDSYLGDGVDLVQLLEQMGASGEMPPPFGVGEAPGVVQQAGPFAGLLASYESQLDGLLRETWEAHRLSPLLRKRAAATNARQDLARIESGDVDRWLRLVNLNRQFADQIGAALATAHGPAVHAAWSSRVDEAMAPWLYELEFSDSAWTWIAAQVEGEARAAAEKAHAAHLVARDAARARATEAVITARAQSRQMMRPLAGSSASRASAANPRVQQALDAKLHELIALEASMRENLLGLLTDEQRKAMEKDLTRRGARPPRR